MTTEERLKELILSKYKSVRAFTIEHNIPYSTVNNIFERGIGNMGISTAIKICNLLNIDVEALVNGEILEKTDTIKSADTLNPKEKELISKLRSYNDEDKQRVYDTFDSIDTEIAKNKTILKLLQEERERTRGFAVAYGGKTATTSYGPEEKKIIDELLKKAREESQR